MQGALWAAPRKLSLITALVTALVAGGAPQGPANATPDELAVIAAASRENSARIETLQLCGTLFATGGHYAGQWDPVTGQTYNSQTQQFAVWTDGVSWRYDVTADREVTPENEVVYNLPYGEHITSYAKLDREGGVDALKREFGTPQSTNRTIVTEAAVYQYRPEANELDLNNRLAVMVLEEQVGVQLARGKVIPGGLTMAELVDHWAELAQRGKRSVEVTSLENGEYLIRTAGFVTREGKPALSCTSEVVVDLDKGGNVVSYIGQVDGRIVESRRYSYMNVGGAWVVSHAEIGAMFSPDGTPTVNGVYDVHAESVRINEPIDPQVFGFESLGVRRGALVFDAETREEYLYDDVPLHLKVALAMEREREEELAEAAAQAAATALPAPAPTEENRQREEAAVRTAKRESGKAATRAAEPTAAREPGVTNLSSVAGHDSAVVSGSAEIGATPAPVLAPPTETRPAQESSEPNVPEVRGPDRQVSERDTRILTPPPAPVAEFEPPENAGSRPGKGHTVPSAVATAVVVGAGCAAAILIGIRRFARRPPRRAG